MKKLKTITMISLVLLFSCHPVNAQTFISKKPVICGLLEDIISKSKDYGEAPFIKGNGTSMRDDGTFFPSQYVIAYNQETNGWTLIEILNPEMACVLSTGKGLEIFNLKQKGMAL